MRRLWVLSGVCVLGSALMAAPSVYGQVDTSGAGRSDALAQREQGLREGMEKARIAEEIIAREEAAQGRPFDAAFLDSIRGDLATRSFEELAEVQKRGSGLLPSPKNLGDSGVDLVFTPVTPCRIINTLVAGGAIAGGTQRSFRVTGVNFAAQGGSSGNCNVPVGATGAVINFVAVGPTGAGDLRYTPFGTPVPTASFLNYVNSGIPNDNIANGMAFPICNPAVSTCTSDFTIQADVSATDVVADVQGFFAAPLRTPFDITLVTNSVSVAAGNSMGLGANCPAGRIITGGGCNFASPTSPLQFISSNPNLPVNWNCFVRNNGGVADTLTVYALCGRINGR